MALPSDFLKLTAQRHCQPGINCLSEDTACVYMQLVWAHMSHITLSCDLSVKIDFSLDSDSKYHEDQEKKGLHFFIGREKV